MRSILRSSVDQSFPTSSGYSDERVIRPRVSHSPSPVTEKERIASIDVLRGVALLGILPMNIQSYSMILTAVFNPMAYGDLHGANYWVWLLSHVLTDQKFMNIFSMLFGAGILLMTSRVEAAGRPSAAWHYRRMGWLILFGLLHGYLLWCGDILFDYGLCGLLVYLFRKRQPRTLLVLGLFFIALPSAFFVIQGVQAQHLPAAQVQAFHDQWISTPRVIAEEVTAYRGSWWTQMRFRAPQALQVELNGFLLRLFGLMLAGMALFRWGIFSAKRSRAFYWSLVGIAVFVGIPVILYGTHRDFTESWNVSMLYFGWQYNYWASLPVSFGWIGLVMLASKSPLLVPATRRLAAVGRMAFTNYIMQSAICTTIFYGHGFGLFGKVNRVGQFGLVLAIWSLQLVISPVWLRHFQFGPLEWLWRSLTYFKWEPLWRRLPQPA
jgi:uncharacterized protein